MFFNFIINFLLVQMTRDETSRFDSRIFIFFLFLILLNVFWKFSSSFYWVFERENHQFSFLSTLKLESSEKIFRRLWNFHQIKSRRNIKKMKYILNMQKKKRTFRVEFFILFIFFSRRLKFWINRKIFRWLLNFHQIISKHDIQKMKYTLKMQNKNRAFLLESFIRSIFFNSRRRSRARFLQNEWIFKAYKCKTLYKSDQVFYMWNLLYINKSNVERSSFIIINYVKFMKNSRNWNFETDEKKKVWDKNLLFSESNLRFSDVKTASSLIKLDLM
jgi:hypothetical protein